MPRGAASWREEGTHTACGVRGASAGPLLDPSQRRNGGHGRMNLASIQAAENKLLLNTYERNPIQFVSGKGVYLRDENGNDFLDLLSGIGVCALGYGHPAIDKAIAEQTATGLLHTSNLFYHQGTADLAVRLTEISG